MLQNVQRFNGGHFYLETESNISLQSLRIRPRKRKKRLSLTMIDIQPGSSTELKVGSRNVTGSGRDWNAKGDLVGPAM